MELVKTVLYAIAIAIFVRTILYEPFNIPSGSMIPTLLVGDYLFVSKFSYGYSKHSLPFSLPVFDGRVFAREPKRGDVAVFKLPTDNKTDYIKRIIGLPGDKIQVQSGVLHINSKPVKRERVSDFLLHDYGGNIRAIPRYREVLPNGRAHFIIEVTDQGPSDNTPVYTVPDNSYFAMGDNRDNSRDSRYLDGVGFVPRVNLVGRAEFLFFSIDGSGLQFWKWPSTVRFSRIFDGIE